jgi:transposase-like protein
LATSHLALPIAHRRLTHTTDLLARLFGQEHRRTRVILHAFGERAALKLMYAALVRAAETWKRVVISEFELKHRQSLRGTSTVFTPRAPRRSSPAHPAHEFPATHGIDPLHI